MAQKYLIHPDFRLLKYLHMPFNRVILAVENFFLSLLYHLQPNTKGVVRKRHRIMARDGYEIKLDFFIPKHKTGPFPAIIYYPGGGFVMPATHIHRYNLSKIVGDLKIIGVMVHYRLSPKYSFPTAFYDAIDALEMLKKNHKDWNILLHKIMLAGDSAGGNLAAGVSLYEKDNHNDIYPQMLVYPALNRGAESESRRLYYDAPMLKKTTLDNVAKVYFRNGYQGMEKYATPCLHPEMTGLGPCYIETAEFDPLHDDGICFHQQLLKAGVASRLLETKGTVHGYDVIRKSPIVMKSVKERHAFIREMLTHDLLQE